MNLYAMIVSVLAATVRMTPVILIPSLGEALSERSGVLNVGVEGYMLMGAVSAYLGAILTGNLWFGLAMGMLAGMILSLVHAYLSITLKSSQIVSGIAIWLFSVGLSAFIFRTVEISEAVEGFSPIQVPILSQLPIIGPILFQHDVLLYLVLLLAPVFHITLFWTRFGLIVRGTGENPLAVDMAGYNVSLIRYVSVLICGAMSGLGGAYLPLAIVHRFSENMTAGRGFIALFIVIFGGWSPWPIVGASLLFAGVDAFQMQIRAAGVTFPYQLLLMSPYVVTMLVLVGLGSVVRRTVMPKKLAVPYTKGEA